LVGFVTVALIGLSLISEGIDSVHRWISIGAFRLNISMALVPIVLFCSVYSDKIASIVLPIFLMGIFILQPDAGQATAFGIAAATILVFKNSLVLKDRLIGITIIIAMSILAWHRPAYLQPVEHVERILHVLAANGAVGISFLFIGILCLFLPIASAALTYSTAQSCILSSCFTVYFATSFIVTEFGNFPVPVIGAGAAPVLGWFLMLVFLPKN
jgi:hypothetical protein